LEPVFTKIETDFKLEKSIFKLAPPKLNGYYLETMSKKQPEGASEAMPFDLDRKYTVKQIARDQLNKSTKTVYDLIKSRKLKAYRIGKELVITASQLNDYAESVRFKHWFSSIAAIDTADLDPAHVTEAPVELELGSLSEKQILSAYIDPAAIAELVDPPASVEPKPKTRKVDESDPSVVDWINDARKSKS